MPTEKGTNLTDKTDHPDAGTYDAGLTDYIWSDDWNDLAMTVNGLFSGVFTEKIELIGNVHRNGYGSMTIDYTGASPVTAGTYIGYYIWDSSELTINTTASYWGVRTDIDGMTGDTTGSVLSAEFQMPSSFTTSFPNASNVIALRASGNGELVDLINGTAGITVTGTASNKIKLHNTTAGTPPNYILFTDAGGDTSYIGHGSSGNDYFYISHYNSGKIVFNTNGVKAWFDGAKSYGNLTIGLDDDSGFTIEGQHNDGSYAVISPKSATSASVLRVMPEGNATVRDTYLEVWGTDYRSDTTNYERAMMWWDTSAHKLIFQTSSNGTGLTSGGVEWRLGGNSTAMILTDAGALSLSYGDVGGGTSSLPQITLGTSGSKNGTIKLWDYSGSNYSVIQATVNNLHLDAHSVGGVYLNYYDGDDVYFGNGAGTGYVARMTHQGYLKLGGTGDPSYPLEVTGTAYISGQLTANGKIVTNSTASAVKFGAYSNLNYGMGFTNDASARYGWATTDYNVTLLTDTTSTGRGVAIGRWTLGNESSVSPKFSVETDTGHTLIGGVIAIGGTTASYLQGIDSYLWRKYSSSTSAVNGIIFQNPTTGTTATDGLLIGLATDEAGYIHHYHNANLYIGINGTWRWYFNTSGDLIPYADNTYQIGNSSSRIQEINIYDNIYFYSPPINTSVNVTMLGSQVVKASSSIRYKYDLEYTDENHKFNATNVIMGLKPVFFRYNQTEKIARGHEFIKYGLIVEDFYDNAIEKGLPTNDDGTPSGIVYEDHEAEGYESMYVQALLIKGMQEQQKEIELLKKQIASLMV